MLSPVVRDQQKSYTGLVSELRKFILKRQAEIEAQGRPLIARKAALQRELSGIEPQIAVLSKEYSELNRALEAIGSEEEENADVSGQGITIKEAIINVLTNVPSGLPSSIILQEINNRFFDGKIQRTSFSPQLSRLKGEEEILQMQGGNYVLNPKKHEGAKMQPSFFSE